MQERQPSSLKGQFVVALASGLILLILAPIVNNWITQSTSKEDDIAFETIVPIQEREQTPATLAPPPKVEKPTQVQSVSVRCPGRDIFPLVPSVGKADYIPAAHWLERVSKDEIKFGYYENGYARDEETLSLDRLTPGRWMSVHEFGKSEYGYVLCVEDLQTVYWATDYMWNFPEVN